MEKDLAYIQSEEKNKDSDTRRINEYRIMHKILFIQKKIEEIKYFKKKRKIDRGEDIPFKDKGETEMIPILKNRLIRYTFTLGLKREPKRNATILTELCIKWTKSFGLRPEWVVVNMGFAIEYQFIIYTFNPENLTTYYQAFVGEIYERIYST